MNALKSEWEGDEKLHHQFGSFENFVSYRRAGAEGDLFMDRSCSFSDSSGDIAVEMAVKFDETTATDAQLKEHFAQTRQLDDEFHNVEGYVAYVHYNRRRARFDQGRSSIGTETVDGFDESRASDGELKEHFSQTQELKDQFSGSECYLALVHHQRGESEREAQRARRHEGKEARAKGHGQLVEST